MLNELLRVSNANDEQPLNIQLKLVTFDDLVVLRSSDVNIEQSLNMLLKLVALLVSIVFISIVDNVDLLYKQLKFVRVEISNELVMLYDSNDEQPLNISPMIKLELTLNESIILTVLNDLQLANILLTVAMVMLLNEFFILSVSNDVQSLNIPLRSSIR